MAESFALKFNVQHRLDASDLAVAVALDAEIERRPGTPQRVYIGSLTKTDIREIGRVRVRGCGLPASWPSVDDRDLIGIARERINQLWPMAEEDAKGGES